MAEQALNSWKEIAQFLGRGVRTVQRWEHELGLPVRRPRGYSKSPVIAFPCELQAWLAASPFHPLCDRVSLLQPTLPIAAVVDHDEIHRYALALSIARRGFSVLEASSGEAALRLFNTIRPDVVLVDVRLPGIDGFEVCRRLKRNAGFNDIPVLILTPYDDRGARQNAELAGAAALFVYPQNADELLGRIDNFARKSSTSAKAA